MQLCPQVSWRWQIHQEREPPGFWRSRHVARPCPTSPCRRTVCHLHLLLQRLEGGQGGREAKNMNTSCIGLFQGWERCLSLERFPTVALGAKQWCSNANDWYCACLPGWDGHNKTSGYEVQQSISFGNPVHIGKECQDTHLNCCVWVGVTTVFTVWIFSNFFEYSSPNLFCQFSQ